MASLPKSRLSQAVLEEETADAHTPLKSMSCATRTVLSTSRWAFGLVAELPGKTLGSYPGVSRFDSCLHFMWTLTWEEAGMIQVTGFLSPTWKTWLSFWQPRGQPAFYMEDWVSGCWLQPGPVLAIVGLWVWEFSPSNKSWRKEEEEEAEEGGGGGGESLVTSYRTTGYPRGKKMVPL